MRNVIDRQRLLVVLIASFLVFVSFGAEAAVKTWTGNGANANWSTAANWSPAGAPAPGDDLVFPAGGLRQTNNNDTAAGTSYNTISFTGPVGGYALQGNAIQLAAGLTANNSGVQNVISLDITLTAPQTFTATGDRIQIFGTVNLGANTLTVNVTTVPSVLELDGTVTGTGGITTTGSGYVYTQASCSYSGPTNVGGSSLFGIVGGTFNAASVVTVSGAGARLVLGNNVSVGPVVIGSGSSITVGGGGPSQIANATSLTMQAGSTYGGTMVSAADNSRLNVSGSVTLGGASLYLDWLYVSTGGSVFTLINKTGAGAVSGTFGGLAEGATFPDNGRTYRISYLGGDGNDVLISDGLPATPPTPVPTLGGAGLAGLVALLAISAFIALRRAA